MLVRLQINRLGQVAAAVAAVLSPQLAHADFTPIGTFTYQMPNGSDVSAVSGTDGLSSALATNALSGIEAQNAANGIIIINLVNSKYFAPIEAALHSVGAAIENSDEQMAGTAAAQALALLNQLKQAQHLKMAYTFLSNTGNNQAIGSLANGFFRYEQDLENSVTSAQTAQQQIKAFVANNIAGQTTIVREYCAKSGIPTWNAVL